MATTSGTGAQYPTVIELPLVSKNPKPQPDWEGPIKTLCPRCRQEVWIHKTIQMALHEVKNIALCKDCMETEKDRQAKS